LCLPASLRIIPYNPYDEDIQRREFVRGHLGQRPAHNPLIVLAQVLTDGARGGSG
jgi:hypothetical protein